MQSSRALTSPGLVTLVLMVAVSGGAAIGRAVNSQSAEAATFYEQGVTLLKAEKFEEAVKAFKQAIKLKPDYADAYDRLGDTYSEMVEFRKAIDAYKESAKYQPNSANTFSKLGASYYAIGEYGKAAEAYNQTIRIDPKLPEIHYKLGATYLLINKEQAAIAEHKTLQTLDSTLAQELYNLIYKPMLGVVSDGVVHLNVIVTGSQGDPATDLTLDDFQVLDEGEPQNISVAANKAAPILLSLGVDSSGSVRPVYSIVISAAKAVLQRTLPQDEVSINRFISSDKLETLQDFTSDQKKLALAFDSLYIEGGQSAVVDAVYVLAQRVVNYRFPQSSPRRVLLLISDGEDRSSYYTQDQLVDMLRTIDVQVFSIGLIADDKGHVNQKMSPRSAGLLTRVASETGGEAYFPKSPAELATDMDRMFSLIRSEYTIQYTPKKPPQPKTFRPVSVTILPKNGHEGYRVTARAGYALSPK